MATIGSALADMTDPLEVELMGAQFVTVGSILSGLVDDSMADDLVGELAAMGSTDALSVLLSVGSVASGRLGPAARAAAVGMVAAGVPAPRWAGELGDAVHPGDFECLRNQDGTASVLACTVGRAGRSHAFAISIDHTNCDAAIDAHLIDEEELPQLRQILREGVPGADLLGESLTAGEFRWWVERALDARAVHDSQDASLGLGLVAAVASGADTETIRYLVTATVLQARIRAMPEPALPPSPARVTGRARPAVARRPATPRAGTASRPRRSPGRAATAPVYQIKVSLRGTRPPIWRRLEVPANITLERLHQVIQVAFHWSDCHLHVFETPLGEYGPPDRDLGHRSDKTVTLSRVAPGVGASILYTYDFGDDWEHQIVVEKILTRDPAAPLLRCTAGRRAAPPEDCGGIYGYEELMEIVSDPHHPEYAERREWLGLYDDDKFDPAAFDPREVNAALAKLQS